MATIEVQAHEQGLEVEVWAQDEHRIGLKPILRRCWAKRGQRPVALVRPQYKWGYLHAFVRPRSGQTFWWLTSWIDAVAFSQVLAHFAADREAGTKRWIILVLDGAGWHRSRQVEIPPGLTLVPLPPYSPELQPAERLWPLTNEPLVNRCIETYPDLEEIQCARCRQLEQQTALIRDRTYFHWWPAA